MSIKVRVWDAPLRLFHWSLVIAVFAAIFTGLQGGSWMDRHTTAGLAVVGLLSFRLAWLVLGSTYARIPALFRAFIALPQYLKGDWRTLGHNPLGVMSMVALLLMLGWQAVSGLFTNDEIAFSGPLSRLVSRSDSLYITGLHRLGLWIMVGLIAVHVLAVLYHVFVLKHNIVKPMLTGDTEKTDEQQQPATGGGWVAFVVALMIAAGGVYLATGAWQPAPPPPPVSAPAW